MVHHDKECGQLVPFNFWAWTFDISPWDNETMRRQLLDECEELGTELAAAKEKKILEIIGP